MALRLKANRRFPSIPVVIDDQVNHTQVLMAVKEALDIGQRRTGDLLNSFIRVGDLIDLGLITIEGNTNAIVGADLSEIANIGDLSSAALGDFLRFDGTEWVNDQLSPTDITQTMVTQHQAALSIAYSQLTGTPTIPSDLDDLTDVAALSPSVDDVLTYNGSQWVAAAPTGGASYLDDLLDVDTPYPDAGDVLTWDGYGWVNEAPPGLLQFVGEVVVAGSAATTMTLTGLNLSSDECYLILLNLANATASDSNISMFFNSDTTATDYYQQRIAVGGAAGTTNAAGRTNSAIINPVKASTSATWEIMLALGQDGRARSRYFLSTGTTTGLDFYLGSHVWNANFANVTSITFSSAVSNALAVGSYFRVFKIQS